MTGFIRFAAAGLRVVLVCTMLVAHQATPARAATKGSCVSDNPIQVELVAEPLRLAMKERGRFRIGVVAANPSGHVIDPELHRMQLLVNGQASQLWSDTIGNGRHEEKWFALPPGESVAATWSTLGPMLFAVPGRYTLALRIGNKVGKPVEVDVSADQASGKP